MFETDGKSKNSMLYFYMNNKIIISAMWEEKDGKK